MNKIFITFLLLLGTTSLYVGCSDDPAFVRQASTRTFVQDYNPEHLDILWVLDDRSPMRAIKESLVADAREFFVRLEGASSDYRMGITSADMELDSAKGKLKPTGAPYIMSKNFGGVEDRATIFADLISKTINLATGHASRGFEAAFNSVTTGQFVPRAGVPLVIVFISDSDDHSQFTAEGAETAVEHFVKKFKALKGGNDDLIRAYSINLTSDADAYLKKCTPLNSTNTDIRQASFEDRYFKLALGLNGDTADICEEWASTIDISGLALKTLPKRFLIEGGENENLFSVTITRGGQSLEIPYTYNTETQELVFETTPPQGSVITVTYLGQ